MLRLLFAPAGYFSTVNGDPTFLNGMNLTGLAFPDPAGMVGAAAVAVLAALVPATGHRAARTRACSPSGSAG